MGKKARTIALLNARAIDLLRHCQYRSASRTFREALARLRLYTQQADDDDDVDVNTTLALFHVHATSLSSRFADENAFWLFDSAVLVTPPSDDNNDNVESTDLDDDLFRSTNHRNLLAAVILFNFGLCLHLSSLATGREATLTSSTVGLYTNALLILQDRVQDGPQTFLALALLNNCGHIHSVFLNSQGIQHCLDQMTLLLHHASQGGTQALPDLLIFFLQNIRHNEGHERRPSPST